MPTAAEHASILKLPIGQVVEVAEQNARNVNSTTFLSIERALVEKLLASKKAEENERGKQPQRVYVQHAVDVMDRVKLRHAFPKWDIKFSGVDPRAASKAHAIYYLVGQYLLDKLNQKKGDVIAYGISLKQIVMRNRRWMHVCVPGHDVVEQAEFKRDDRAIVVMAKSLERSGKSYDLAREYAEGRTDCYCGNPQLCEKQAKAGIMLLNRTDTNFRQIAYYMKRHGTRLLYFGIPGSKHMEYASEGRLEELDAYTFPSDGGRRINLTHRGDVSLDASFLHANYLELIARTSVIVDGMCYHKEHDSEVLGVHIFKVTAFPASEASPTLPPYLSWNEPDYKKKYMVRVPILRPGGSVYNRSDWYIHISTQPRDILDEVSDWAMRMDGVPIREMPKLIERRLVSKMSHVAGHGQILPSNSYMAVDEYDMLKFVIFVTVFMRKYVQGKTISTLAPHARELASLSQSGFFSISRLFLVAKARSIMGYVDGFVSGLRSLLFEQHPEEDIPLPEFAAAIGYTAYDNSATNPLFKGWSGTDNPLDGFSPSLPGVRPVPIPSDISSSSSSSESQSIDYQLAQKLIVAGEATITEDGRLLLEGDTCTVRIGQPPPTVVEKVFGWMSSSTTREAVTTRMPVAEDSEHRVDAKYEMRLPGRERYQSHDPKVNELVDRILNDTSQIGHMESRQRTQVGFLDVGKVPDIVPGAVSDVPELDLREALNTIFPGTSTMDTSMFESDKQYGDVDFKMRGAKISIDMSKLGRLKPERIFKPKIRSHVQPDAKNTLHNTLLTIEKRNANTPADADPLSFETVWGVSWAAYLKVFCIPGAEKELSQAPYIGPDRQSILEWVSALPTEKFEKLVKSEKGFALDEMTHDLFHSHFMLKGKMKPDLTHSFASSLKMPQSIQYDASGRSTAVFTPVFAQKVDREQSLLKSNVLIMQRKSVQEVNEFLNRFDWRPDSRGQRYYLECDYSQFDKSQGAMATELHWRKCVKFGILPEYLKWFRDNTDQRTVSAMKAGVKLWLKYQRGTGFPNTLDGNNDVNTMVMAEFLERILDVVEFIIMQGDDMTIAVRGKPDIVGWEHEINRKYNLSIKVQLHTHGYICSMDIVHYPDGHSRVIPDIVKRALAFTQQSFADEAKFDERFISFADNMDGIQDRQVQMYLQGALPTRYQYILPTLTQDSVRLLCKALARLRVDKQAFRNLFASVPSVRFF